MTYTYKYPRPAVTADCVVITKEEQPKVLLIQRSADPYKGCWAFPGGFMNMDETTEQCAIRELEEETGLRVSDVHQIGAYSKVDRDPRGRTITVAYLAIIDKPVQVTGQDDAAKAEWFPLSALPELAFDHAEIMRDAVKAYMTQVVSQALWNYLCIFFFWKYLHFSNMFLNFALDSVSPQGQEGQDMLEKDVYERNP